jgi:hypothetical protein
MVLATMIGFEAVLRSVETGETIDCDDP